MLQNTTLDAVGSKLTLSHIQPLNLVCVWGGGESLESKPSAKLHCVLLSCNKTEVAKPSLQR